MRAIVAMDGNRVIGNKGEIPWHIPDDMKWFKRVTLGIPWERAIHTNDWNAEPISGYGGTVVMGRKTFKKVGPLPGRYTYCVTRDPEKLALPKTDTCKYATFNDVILLSQVGFVWGNTWVVGGAEIYKLFMPQCTDIFVTHVLEDYEGDTFMPYFEDQFQRQDIIKETKSYWIVRYSRCLPSI